MAHALRRISYATCDLPQQHFSFLAREPKGHFSLQYCHAFVTDNPQQAEELSRLVGEAFRMAFAQQLHQTPTSSFLDLVNLSAHHSPSRSVHLNAVNGRCDPSSPGPSGVTSDSARNSEDAMWTSNGMDEMSVHLFGYPRTPVRSAETSKTERVWAKTMINKQHDPLVDRGAIRMSPLSPERVHPPSSLPPLPIAGTTSDLWSPSSTSSCEDNTGLGLLGSPTEVNSCLQFKEKPQLVKNFESSWTTVLVDSHVTNQAASATPVVRVEDIVRPGSGGYVNENASRNEDIDLESKFKFLHKQRVSMPSPVCSPPLSPSRYEEEESELTSSTANLVSDSKRNSQSSTANSESGTSLTSLTSDDSKTDSSNGRTGKCQGSARCVVTPPPIPERHDSLSSQEEEEVRELRGAPWFQAGIPREIALEILAQEPVGSFMVRESTSKPGCYALSLRVPRDFQPAGIAHYLIMRTQRGFKIKGFTKEFCTLTALITHHSVMPELLPCPLSLSRYNPVFRKQDTSEDLVDIEDPDFNLLSDFRKVMADLKA